MEARRLSNSRGDFGNTPVLTKGCVSYHTPLRNSNIVFDSGLNKVSYIRKLYVTVRGSQIKSIKPFVI